jgi:hypothetical protein
MPNIIGFTLDPANTSVVEGAAAQFSATAFASAHSGSTVTGITFQWKKNGVNVVGGTPADTWPYGDSDHGHSTYDTPATALGDDGDVYTCVATATLSVAGPLVSAPSAGGTLSVTCAAPTIDTQPQDQSVETGATASFSVVASSNCSLSYQWYKDGNPIFGATSASYTTPATVLGDSGSVYTVDVINDDATTTSDGATLTVTDPCVDTMNCDCEAESPYEDLATLRIRMMVRLGYSAMARNPPSGMIALIDDFLQSAQKSLYQKNPDLRTTRIFKWTMVEGQRFYNVDEDESCCGVTLDPRRVKWVGIEDLNGHWTRLVEGIPPEFYTTVLQQGLPLHYEIRSCIEVLPAPNAAYILRIKGDFGMTAFTNPEHKTTIDSEVVFLTALAYAKKHYKQADADATKALADQYLQGMKADKHLTARYVPGAKPLRPRVQPIMTAFDDE